MKKNIFIFMMTLLGMIGSFKTYASSEWDQLVEDAALLLDENPPRITGWAVGYGGTPGEFFIFSTFLLEKGKKTDFENLLKQPNPVLKALGIVGIVRQGGQLPKTLLQDTTTIQVTESGCSPDSTTLGAWAAHFMKDPNSLGHSREKFDTQDYRPFYLAQSFFYKGEDSLNRNQLEKAKSLIEAALRHLGKSYQSPTTIDDTGQKLAAAREMIKQGNTKKGLQMMLNMLKVRLDLFIKKSQPQSQ